MNPPRTKNGHQEGRLNVEELVSIVKRLNSQFGLAGYGDDMDVEKYWRRSDRDVVLITNRCVPPHRLILKRMPHLRMDELALAFRTLNDAATRLSSDYTDSTIRLPRALGWDGQSRVLAMEYLEGDEWGARLQASRADTDELVRLLSGCGSALARLHHVLARAGPALTEDEFQSVHTDLRAVCRRMAVTGSVAQHVRSHVLPIRGHGDFVTSNVLIDNEGRLGIIDLPARLPALTREYDIAMAIFALRRVVGATANADSRRAFGRIQDTLVQAFLEGYVNESGDRTLQSKPSTVLIRGYEAHRVAARARTAARKRHPFTAMHHALWAIGVRLRGRVPYVVRALDQHTSLGSTD